jgi:hypothetical protein
MVSFTNIITAPYKLAGAAPTLLLNLCTGKTDINDLNPCHKNDSTTSTNSDGKEEKMSNPQKMSNPLGGILGGGGGKNTKFLDYSWNKLPGKSRKAAETLGYNESTWGKGWANCKDKWWEDLTTTEREAALTLGWDQSAWDSFYEDKNWEDLPKHVQEAAKKFGYTAQMWNDDEWPSSTDKWWNQFSDEHKKALNTLGYTEYDWE